MSEPVVGADASGGPNTRDPRLRAVGWAVVICRLVNGKLEEVGTMSGLLPRMPQSLKGKLVAIIQAIKATKGSLDLTSDCKPALKALMGDFSYQGSPPGMGFGLA